LVAQTPTGIQHNVRRVRFSGESLVYKSPWSTLPPPRHMSESTVISRLFILAGQSNMVGRADPAVCWNVKVPPSSIRWCNDLNFGSDAIQRDFVTLEPQYSSWRDCHHWGPELGMDLGGAAHTAYLVKFAMGSTRIREHWHPDLESSMYPHFLAFVREAIAAAPPPARFEGFFWLQGESDSGSAKLANAYHDDLVALVQAVRRDLECDELPFVASHIVWPNGKKVGVINEALTRACEGGALGPYAACVPSDGYTTNAEQAHHMDTPSIILAGQRMSEAYRQLVSGRMVVR